MDKSLSNGFLIAFPKTYPLENDFKQLNYWDQDSNSTYKCINEGSSTFFTLI